VSLCSVYIIKTNYYEEKLGKKINFSDANRLEVYSVKRISPY
jgi:hypothetical protein